MSFLPWLSQATLCPSVSLPKNKPWVSQPFRPCTYRARVYIMVSLSRYALFKGLILGFYAHSLSRIQLFVTPWTVAHKGYLLMRFSWQVYWSGLPLSFSMLPVVQLVKNPPAMQVRFLGWEDTLEKGWVTYSSIFGLPYSSRIARQIPWTEKPGRLHTVHGVTKSQIPLRNFLFLWLTNRRERDVPGAPVVKTPDFHKQGAWVRSLVRELRSHMLHDATKK